MNLKALILLGRMNFDSRENLITSLDPIFALNGKARGDRLESQLFRLQFKHRKINKVDGV